MKILFIIPSFAKGGQEKAGMLLCNYLVKYHDVTAVCFGEKEEGEYHYECKIVRIPVATSEGPVAKVKAGYQRIRLLKAQKRLLRPDVSIAFGNTAIILNALSSIGEKKIASIRQSFRYVMNTQNLGMRIHLKLYVWALRRADYIVPVSKAINQELKSYFHISNDLYINNGFSREEVARQTAEPVSFMQDGRLWLVHSGRFDQSKGHWHLVKIFSLIKKQLPGTGLVLLGGKDTSSATGAAIEKYCKEYFSKQNISWSENPDSRADVVFLGHQENPLKYMANASLFVFPSLWEGFPNALLEALGCGTPAVAADCPTGPKELLREKNESFGLLLPPFKDDFYRQENSLLEHEWADAMVKLLKDECQLSYYRRQSLKRAEKFTREKTGEQWQELVCKLFAS